MIWLKQWTVPFDAINWILHFYGKQDFPHLHSVSCLSLPIVTTFWYVASLIVVTALESEIVIVSWKNWAVDLLSSLLYLSSCDGLLARFFEGIWNPRGLNWIDRPFSGRLCVCKKGLCKQQNLTARFGLLQWKWASVAKPLREGIMSFTCSILRWLYF
jgi:hypothetical protein